MYYKLKSNILFRKYETYGYITDDRNYRYIKDEVIGERIVSDSGAVFLSTLSKQPKSINKICLEIQNIYPDIDINLIRNDAEDFFSELVVMVLYAAVKRFLSVIIMTISSHMEK